MTVRSRPPKRKKGTSHIVADQSAVVALLSSPTAYGEPVDRVERIDTHAAMVFLAGSRAYKIKRAVRYPYLDASTLARRRRLCEKEISINRRTAPELYLGTMPVTRADDGKLRLGGKGEVEEWVIAMRRFAQDGLFDHLAEAGKLTPELLTAAVDAVAAFHDAAEPVSATATNGGGRAGMEWVVTENVDELRERPDLFPASEVADFAEASRRELDHCGKILDERQAKRLVRRCHGDLHLRNICLLDGNPTIFDAIEFNDVIACIDVIYDLAFLLMDLDHRGLRPYANLALNRYMRRRPDLGGLVALPLFLSARAAVRAKICASAEASQAEDAARRSLRREAGGYFEAARRYLKRPAKRLVAVGGFSGVGKTRLARRLALELGAAPGALHLQSDFVRKRLLGAHELSRLPQDAYTPSVSNRVYEILADEAERALRAGHSVIVDAVHGKSSGRAELAALARKVGARFTGIWLDAPAATLLTRVASRRKDASDATPGVVRQQLRQRTGRITWHRVNTNRPPSKVLAEVRKLLS
ncbi:MAG: AAA family ATPase [Alphaproteobacteria bacterium]